MPKYWLIHSTSSSASRDSCTTVIDAKARNCSAKSRSPHRGADCSRRRLGSQVRPPPIFSPAGPSSPPPGLCYGGDSYSDAGDPLESRLGLSRVRRQGSGPGPEHPAGQERSCQRRLAAAGSKRALAGARRNVRQGRSLNQVHQSGASNRGHDRCAECTRRSLRFVCDGDRAR
jgi:hypothetical protein